jgi:signal transduction histidine kinase
LRTPVPLATATALYRITQEAFRNAAKHAPGALVTVELSSTDQELRLSVRDDGPGFDVNALQQQGGLGFISMRERAKLAGGKLLLSTGVGNGTEVVAVLPWQRVTEPADP